jgi:CheY-like chemotaxis protein
MTAILLALMMPHGNGLEVLIFVRGRSGSPCIVVFATALKVLDEAEAEHHRETQKTVRHRRSDRGDATGAR